VLLVEYEEGSVIFGNFRGRPAAAATGGSRAALPIGRLWSPRRAACRCPPGGDLSSCGYGVCIAETSGMSLTTAPRNHHACRRKVRDWMRRLHRWLARQRSHRSLSPLEADTEYGTQILSD
jgi:hypothetical protein